MKKISHPLISCLCVTREKPVFLHRAINCFHCQTYPNKELVIVYDDDDIITKKALKSITHKDISIYEVKKTEEITLGYLRNYAIKKSKGEYVCQWDDDDWYHMARLEYQFEAIRISGFPACIMTQWLIFNNITKKAFVSHRRLWEGSLLCKKSTIADIHYDHFNIGEDTSFIQSLEKENKLYYIDDVPNLYIYTYHGRNTWDKSHWLKILESSFELSSDDSEIVNKVLNKNGDFEDKSLEIDKLLENALLAEDNFLFQAKIPKIIHLIYKSKSIPDLYKDMYNRMKFLHPDWEIIVYDDAYALEIVKEYFPEILEIYESYPCDVQRTDIFRILIVYLKGGFYLDLDMYCLRDLDDLCQFEIVLGEERTISHKKNEKWDSIHGLQIANYMFGSVPKQQFWIEVLLEGINRSSNKVITETDILKITGPWLLSEVYHNKKKEYDSIKLIRNKFRLCLNHCETISCHFGGYAAHFHSGSWKWQKEGSPQIEPINKSNKKNHRTIMTKAHKRMTERLDTQ